MTHYPLGAFIPLYWYPTMPPQLRLLIPVVSPYHSTLVPPNQIPAGFSPRIRTLDIAIPREHLWTL